MKVIIEGARVLDEHEIQVNKDASAEGKEPPYKIGPMDVIIGDSGVTGCVKVSVGPYGQTALVKRTELERALDNFV